MLVQAPVADPPDVDRVHLDLFAAGRNAHERAGVASAVGVSADECLVCLDDVVDLDTEVLKGVQERGEDVDRAALARLRETVVVDVLVVQEFSEGVEVVVGQCLGEALGERAVGAHLDAPLAHMGCSKVDPARFPLTQRVRAETSETVGLVLRSGCERLGENPARYRFGRAASVSPDGWLTPALAAER